MPRDDTLPPVGLRSDWLPVDHPQYLPSGPHRLPPINERPARRVGGPLMGVTPPSTPGAEVPAGAALAFTFEPHRYAQMVEGTVTLGTSDSGVAIITANSNRRNLLGFRNNDAVATVYIGFGRLSSSLSWLAIPPGDAVLFDTVVPQDDIYASASGVGVTLSYAYSTFAIPS